MFLDCGRKPDYLKETHAGTTNEQMKYCLHLQIQTFQCSVIDQAKAHKAHVLVTVSTVHVMLVQLLKTAYLGHMSQRYRIFCHM